MSKTMKQVRKMLSENCDGAHLWTIDPGVGGTGIARWEDWRTGKLQKPSGTFIITPSGNTNKWEDRFHNVMHNLVGKLTVLKPDVVILEKAELWSGSARSRTAAKRGDTFKLAYLVGAILWCAMTVPSLCVLVSPQDWKGQLSKEMVISRIQDTFKLRKRSLLLGDHVSDAVGMGLSLMGAL